MTKNTVHQFMAFVVVYNSVDQREANDGEYVQDRQ